MSSKLGCFRMLYRILLSDSLPCKMNPIRGRRISYNRSKASQDYSSCDEYQCCLALIAFNNIVISRFRECEFVFTANCGWSTMIQSLRKRLATTLNQTKPWITQLNKNQTGPNNFESISSRIKLTWFTIIQIKLRYSNRNRRFTIFAIKLCRLTIIHMELQNSNWARFKPGSS